MRNLFVLLVVNYFIFMLSACGETPLLPKLANIKEASGVSYCKDSNTLVVANDEGAFYEVSVDGKIIATHKLGKYDLEGVVCEKDRYIFAEESGVLLVVNRKTLKHKQFKLDSKIYKISKKSGIEGIVKVGALYYLAIQAKKKKDARLLVVKLGKNYAKVIKSIKSGIVDSAGLEYREDKLYIVSDKKDKLYIFNLKKSKITKEIKLPKFAQEGIAFGRDNDIFLADDNGALLKYKPEELGLSL